MAKPTPTQLNRWAANLPDRRVIEDFLDWCETKRIELAQWQESGRYPVPLMGRDSLLNEYHEIDAAQLECERRALLESARKLASPPQPEEPGR